MLQGMGAAPELTPLPSIGLSDMEELGLMEPRQAPAPEEPIQAVARRLSEPAAEAAELSLSAKASDWTEKSHAGTCTCNGQSDTDVLAQVV